MATELTAEQKIRQTLTGSPFGGPDFPSEGENVIRWLTGGTSPDVWVTFHPEGEQITVRCAGCRTIIGHLPADPFAKDEIVRQIGAIREAGHEHHKPADWPRIKVIPEAD
jgi:hypothetical protein